MRLNNLEWLDLAEYLCLTLAVVGAVAGVGDRQILYAALPLAACIFLNLVRRQQTQQSDRQSAMSAIAVLEERLTRLRTQWEGDREQMQQLRASIEQVGDRLDRLDLEPPASESPAANESNREELDCLVAAMQQQQRQLRTLSERLDAIGTSAPEPPAESPQSQPPQTPPASEPNWEQLQNLPEAIATLTDRIAQLGRGMAQVLQRLERASDTPDRSPAPSVGDLADALQPLARAVSEIQQQIAGLEPRTGARPTTVPSETAIARTTPSPGPVPTNFGIGSDPRQNLPQWGNTPNIPPESSITPAAFPNAQPATVAPQEFVRRYQQGERNFPGVNLEAADLARVYPSQPGSPIDLRGVNLVGSSLTGANFAGGDLAEANLSEADLSHADLRQANLAGANLAGANLDGADLEGANLIAADLRGINFRNVYLRQVNLSSANLCRQNFAGFDLSGFNLSRANLTYADLSGATLEGADLTGADLTGANLDGTYFGDGETAARLDGAILPDGSRFE
jgi:uncharacterized protein YjbI with pentapeptide repeats/prefoldin subunit 5